MKLEIADHDNDKTALFYCTECNNDIRVIQSGNEPANPCFHCGVSSWVRLTDEAKAEFFATRFGRARVYFCSRETCRTPIVYWEGGNVSEPCVQCGSKMFEELIGPERQSWLHANAGKHKGN